MADRSTICKLACPSLHTHLCQPGDGPGERDLVEKDYLMDKDRHLVDQPQTEARLASFPEKNSNPILEINMEGQIAYANPAIYKLFATP